MAPTCDHSGFHSGIGKISQERSSIRFLLVCDDCGTEVRDVEVERYSPDYDPSGGLQGRRAA
jgi:hypothetical protein